MFAQIELLFDPFVDLIDFPGNVLFFFGHIPANNLGTALESGSFLNLSALIFEVSVSDGHGLGWSPVPL